MIILYTTGCPKCKVLKQKMDSKNIKYSECSDVSEMESLGIKQVPVLKIDNDLLPFKEAVDWINRQ
jgi:glutaredoxin